MSRFPASASAPRRRLISSLVCLFTVLGLAPAPVAYAQGGAADPKTTKPAAGQPAAGKTAPAKNAKPTEAEIDAMADKLESQLVPMGMDIQNILNSGDVRSFEKIFSRQAFAYQIMQGIDYGGKLTPELSKVLGEAANMGVLFYPWDTATRFRFLNVRNVDGRLGLFMRCIHPNGSVSYFTFYLGPGPDNDGLRVVDIYTHRASLRRSTLARHFVAYTSVNQGWLQAKQVKIDLSVPDLKKISEMGAALSNENLPAINTLYGGLSDQGKELPFVIMMHMAANLDTWEVFEADFKKMNQIAPQEMAQDLMMIDKLTSIEKWDESIAALKALDAKVEGDPYITLKIARCYYEKGDAEMAGKTAIAAIKAEPELHAAYMLLLDLEVDRKKFDGAVKMLKLLADKFQLVIAPEEFEKSEDYAEFRKSPSFEDWKKYAEQKKAELSKEP